MPARTHELSASRRGYDAAWRRTVEAAIRLTPWCVRCGTTGDPTNPLSGDHIIPLSKGGTSDPSNVRTLCRRCNSRKGAR